jgi:hypothetical protein
MGRIFPIRINLRKSVGWKRGKEKWESKEKPGFLSPW